MDAKDMKTKSTLMTLVDFIEQTFCANTPIEVEVLDDRSFKVTLPPQREQGQCYCPKIDVVDLRIQSVDDLIRAIEDRLGGMTGENDDGHRS